MGVDLAGFGLDPRVEPIVKLARSVDRRTNIHREAVDLDHAGVRLERGHLDGSFEVPLEQL